MAFHNVYDGAGLRQDALYQFGGRKVCFLFFCFFGFFLSFICENITHKSLQRSVDNFEEKSPFLGIQSVV